MTDTQDSFAKNLFGAFVRTFIWSVGEVENIPFAADVGNSMNMKASDVLSKLILVVFIFLFVIVMMNVLNAFAIGDIQVNITEYLIE